MCSRFSEQMALYRQNTAEEVEQFRKDTAADVEQLRTDTASDVAALRKMTAQDVADITQKVDAANSAVAASKSEMDKTAETLKAQINANVKASTDKNANYAQELVDARVDDEGKTYPTAGDNIRAVGRVRSMQNIMKNWVIKNGYANQNGNLVASESWRVAHMVPVRGDAILVDGQFGYMSGRDDYNNVVCYDMDRKFLGGCFRAESGKVYDNYVITLLPNTRFISVTTNEKLFSKLSVYLYDNMLPMRLLSNYATGWQWMNGSVDIRFTGSKVTVTFPEGKSVYVCRRTNGIQFEKENLDTADPTSDFILTTLAAIAQEESRSISSNIRLGQKMRFPKGDVPNKIMYGYRYNGKMVTSESGYEYKDIEIVEEEARVVRRIFHEVVEGKAYTEIARGLNMDKIPAPVTDAVRVRKKKSKKGQLNSDLLDGWTGGNITRIVRAERYMGAVLIQKKFTSDYLTHEVRDNKGEVPQYFVRNHHPAIVDEDLFEKAQEVVKVNSDLYNRTRSGKKPRAFSQKLICGECGRFFHVTNGNGNYPIWRCPTSSRTTGNRICHAEKVYEEQVVRAFRKAVLERFRLTLKPIHDNVAVADIMSGRFKEQYDNFTPEADSFVSQMLARLESIQKLDFMERDRAFYKKQIAAAHTSVESTSKKIRLLKSQVDVMQTRLELLGDEMIDPASIEEKKKLIEKLECDIQKDTDTEQKLTEQLDYMEDYWEELEGDYERREKAIEWMKQLPAGRDGTMAFLNGVTEEHCKAFLLSITIHSPLKFTVHWFDDTKTEVEMDSNIEDYRNTASYYDGHTMRDGSQRKRHVR